MDLLDKLYDRLVGAVEAAGANAFPKGVTVADVYQRLIPYRTVRGQVGVVELAEYEHALLRLLSGERQYVEVGDPAVKLEVQRELASLNPILGIYRDYSTARLALLKKGPRVAGGSSGASGPAAASAAAEGGAPGADEAARGQEGGSPKVGPAVQDATRVDLPPPPPRTAAAAPPVAPRLTTVPAVDQCADCGRSLPGIADLLYCPFCGAAQTPRPCARCGGEMQRGWSFCPRCGAGRAAAGETS